MEKYDHLEIRCPRLGGEVTFFYCRRERDNLPCPRIIECWEVYFPVEKYLSSKLSPEEWECCFNQVPKNKVMTLIELIEAAKKQKQVPD